MNPPSPKPNPAETSLERLLRAAARMQDEPAPEMPLGFDTRVVALSRRNGNGAIFGALLCRATLVAAAVIVLASAGAYFEFNRNNDALIGSGNEFAIADSAIQDEVAQ